MLAVKEPVAFNAPRKPGPEVWIGSERLVRFQTQSVSRGGSRTDSRR